MSKRSWALTGAIVFAAVTLSSVGVPDELIAQDFPQVESPRKLQPPPIQKRPRELFTPAKPDQEDDLDDFFAPKPPPRKSQDPFDAGPDGAEQNPFGGRAKQADPFGGNDPFGGEDPFDDKPRKKRTVAAVAAGATDDEAASAARNAATLKALARELSVEIRDVPLVEGCKFFGERLEVQFYVDPRGLDDAVIPLDSPCNLSLRDVPAEMALDMMLDALDLDWYLRDGVVIVTTKDVVERHLTTIVYDVSKFARTTVTPPRIPRAASASARDRNVFVTQLGGQFDGEAMKNATPETEVGKLVEVITSTIAPDSWDSVGGAGVVRPYRNALIVTQTDRVHRDLAKLLRDIERTVAE